MYSILKIFWQKRTPFEKLMLVLLFGALVYIGIITIQKGIYKYRYFKSIEQEYQVAKDSINALNLRITDLTNEQEKTVKQVRKRSKTINEKLKSDEKIIDNKPVTDDELDEFLSRYD